MPFPKAMPKHSDMHEIFQYIGNWGRFQIFAFSLFFIPCMISCAIIMLPIFTAAIPNTRCFIPGVDDQPGSSYSTVFDLNETSALLPPPLKVAGANMYCTYCPSTHNGSCTEQQSRKCENFVYDKEQYAYTLTSMFDLVCDNYYKTQLINMCTMIGVLLGNTIFANVGDKYGRKTAFMVAGILQILVVNIMPFSPNFYVYCALQVAAGAVQAGSFLAGFTMGEDKFWEYSGLWTETVIELFGGISKTIFGVAVQAMTAFGYVYVGAAAYFIRDWRYLTWTVGFLTVCYVPLYWLYPESVRWLAVRHRQKEAADIVKKAAKWNHVEIPDEVLVRDLTIDNKVHMCSMKELFGVSDFVPVTLIVFLLWLVDGTVYYGLSWGSTSLPGDTYVNFVLSGLSELPSYMICVPLMEYVGRRFTLFGFLSTGGLSIMLSGFSGHSVVVQVLTNIGKFCISASFAVTYIYTCEIFPTVIRNLVTGYGSSVSRIGGMSSTQIALLAKSFGFWIPATVYGTCALVASILVCFLPETVGTEMTETLEEGAEFIRTHKLSLKLRKCGENVEEEQSKNENKESTYSVAGSLKNEFVVRL